MFKRVLDHYAYFEWREKGRTKEEKRGEAVPAFLIRIACPLFSPPMAKVPPLFD
jgi:hypothetical protein